MIEISSIHFKLQTIIARFINFDFLLGLNYLINSQMLYVWKYVLQNRLNISWLTRTGCLTFEVSVTADFMTRDSFDTSTSQRVRRHEFFYRLIGPSKWLKMVTKATVKSNILFLLQFSIIMTPPDWVMLYCVSSKILCTSIL